MENSNIISDYIMAGFPLLGVNTYEPDQLEVLIDREIKEIIDPYNKQKEGSAHVPMTLYAWDCVAGLRNVTRKTKIKDKHTVIESLFKYFISPDVGEKAILVLHNFHTYLMQQDMSIIQTILNMVPVLKTSLRTMVFSGPYIELPPELERYVTVLDHPLPNVEQIRTEYEKIIDEWVLKFDKKAMDKSVQIAKGLTLFEAENAISLSAVREKTLNPDIIFDIKSQLIKRNGDLEIANFNETLNDLKGLENLKEFGREVISHPLSRGILLLGVAGCGKSHFAKALGKEIGLVTVTASMGDMFSALVGSSEGKIKTALRIIDAMAPLLLFIDEMEKDFAGLNAAAEHDSGVTKRVLKEFLVWMNDHESRVPMIATANEIKNLPSSFLRSERWDAIFFVDLPTEEEMLAILDHYLKYYDLKTKPEDVTSVVDLDNWTGAEIKTMCRLANIMKGDVEKASRYVVPICKSKEDEINEMRSQAREFAVNASLPSTIAPAKKERKKVRKVMTTTGQGSNSLN